MINIGIIGCGYWGPNLIRNLDSLSNVCVVSAAELDQERINYLQEKYPHIKTTTDYFDLFDKGVDAVVIATGPQSHYSLAKQALSHGKHVLVEKPLAMDTSQAKELVDLAEKNGLILMVGHTFEHNAAVWELKRQIQSNTIGKPYYICSQRLNFGVVRQDVNVLWSLAPHDISILIYILDVMPLSVSVKGYDFIQKGIEDVAFMTLDFPNNIKAHVHVSWLDPNKARNMTLVGEKRMVVYDDMADNKVTIFDKGIQRQNLNKDVPTFDDFSRYQLIKHVGDVHIPHIDFHEPLKAECEDFIESIQQQKPSKTDGLNGLKVVHVLQAADMSLKNNGMAIKINEDYSKVPQRMPV